MKSMGRWFVLLCLFAFAIGTLGCQSIGDKIAEEAAEGIVKGATGVDVEADDGSVTIQNEDGSTFVASESGDLPADFPDDVPVPEGDITSTMATEDNFTVVIEISDEAADVYDWCLEEVKAEGWTVTAEFKVEDGGSISAEKDGNLLQYTMSQDDDETSLIVFTGPE